MIQRNPYLRYIIPIAIIISLVYLLSTNFGQAIALVIFFTMVYIILYFLYYNMWAKHIGAIMVFLFGRSYFMQKMIPLLAAMLKVDDHVSSTELSQVKRFFQKQFKPEKASSFSTALDEFIKNDLSLKKHIASIKYSLPDAEKKQLIHTLVWIATIDRVLTKKEKILLKYITVQLGIRLRVYHQTLRLFEFQNEKDYYEQSRRTQSAAASSNISLLKKAYKVLDIDASATDKEIKKAYRNLAKKYHPDRVFHQKEMAKTKFQTITAAYDLIKNERGFV